MIEWRRVMTGVHSPVFVLSLISAVLARLVKKRAGEGEIKPPEYLV